MLKRWGFEPLDVLYAVAASTIGIVLGASAIIMLGSQLVSLMSLGVPVWAFAAVMVLAIVVVAWNVTRFVGPQRASMAELAWRPEQARARETLWVSAAIVGVTVAALTGLFASITHNLAMSTPEVIAWTVLAWGSSLGAFQAAQTAQKEGHASVPRWRLLRADANVRSAHSAYLSIDGAAITVLRDQRARATRTPITPAIQPTALSLARTVAIRNGADQWLFAGSILIFSALGGIVLGPVLGQLIAAAGAVAMALRQSRAWAAWRASSLIRRSLSIVRGQAEAAMLVGTCTLPQLVGAAAMLAAGWARALPGIATVALAVIYVVIERTRALAALERSGPLGAMLQLPDLGPVPTGLFSKVLSGWGTAVTCCYFAVVHSSFVPALVLAALVTISAIRQLRA